MEEGVAKKRKQWVQKWDAGEAKIKDKAGKNWR